MIGGGNMKQSLRTRLSLSYIVIVLICIFLISILSNMLLEGQFKKYVIQNQEQKNKDIVNMLTQQYSRDGRWREDIIENIGINALENGMIVSVKDSSGKVLWDARIYNNGMCRSMISHMAQNMFSRYPNFKGGYVENEYPVTVNSKNAGYVKIGYYGPFYYTDNDLIFLNTLNRVILGVGFISLLFALGFGMYMARKISMPISRAVDAAEMISKGKYHNRIEEKSGIREISQLTTTINDLAENLEKQELLRKRLTGDVAHELRTPIATLQSHIEAMIDGIWEPDVKRLTSCHEEIMRISRMVGDLEKLAKYEGENLVLNKTEFDISELIQNIILNFENEYMQKGIKINFNGKKEMVLADRDKISQVIVNLISNALKYSKDGGKVDITVSGSENETRVTFKDNGIGISSEDLPFIFERFYRADKSRSRLTGGSGIGLTITKAIVEAHKGRIEVRSKLGEGTEFTIIIPKVKG